MSDKIGLLVLNTHSSEHRAILSELYDLTYAPAPGERAAAITTQGAKFRAVLTIGVLGLTAGEIAAMPALELICCMGAGYELVDVEAARARGIALANGQGTNDNCVADHAFGLVIAAVRNFRQLDRLDSRFRLDIEVVRNGELRVQSVSYALGFLAVLTVVHTERDGAARMISFRPASSINVRSTMPGLKTNAMNRKEVLAAVRGTPLSKDFVWDGVDEGECAASSEELQAGVSAYRKRGRPVSEVTKEQVAIRFDREVLSAFRAAGPGWQTRMNEALKDWLRTHSPV